MSEKRLNSPTLMTYCSLLIYSILSLLLCTADLFDRVKSRYGPVRVVINCAAVMLEKEWKKTIEVNVVCTKSDVIGYGLVWLLWS